MQDEPVLADMIQNRKPDGCNPVSQKEVQTLFTWKQKHNPTF